MPKIEVIVKNPTEGGFLYEGPHYCSADGFLYYVDIIGNKIGRFDTKGGDGKNVWIYFSGEERVTFIVPIGDSSGREFLIGQGKGVVHATVDWDLAKVLEAKTVYRPKHQEEDDTRTNDGKCDPQGRLWFGTMTNTDPLAPDTSKRRSWSLFRLDGRGGGERVLQDVSLSNGLAWNSDLGAMYFIDSLAATVDAFDYDADSGGVSNRRSVFDISDAGMPGFLDGMTVDTRGHLWIAIFNGGRVVEVDPTTKKVVSEIQFADAKKITSVAFGGSGLDELYVTAACVSGDPSAHLSEAGSIYRITGLGEEVKGLPMAEFPRKSLESLFDKI